MTPSSPLPPNYLDVLLYIGTPNHNPSSLGFYHHFPSMTTAGARIGLNAISEHTPLSVQGGFIISTSTITPSTAIFGSSIPSSSEGSQAFFSPTGSFPFEMPSSEIPLVPLSIPFVVSTTMTSMASGSTSF